MTPHQNNSETIGSSLIRLKSINQRLALGFLSLVALQSIGQVFAQTQATAAPPAQDAAAPQTLEQTATLIDQYMNKLVQDDHFSGSILISQNGKPIISKGYGKASIEWNIPNTPQTAFRAGSLTKQFTAMAIVMLQERGKLKVSDSICKYLSNCPKAWNLITLGHLMSHTSGIWSYSNASDWLQTTTHLMSQPQFIDQFRDRPLLFIPGERFDFSNSGYYLLGVVIERASHQTYESFLTENIFKPLAMNSTGFDTGLRSVNKLAMGYSLSPSHVIAPHPFTSINFFSEASMYSTTEDLSLWDQALYIEKLVSKKSLEEIFTPFKLNNGNSYGYGYGWDIRGTTFSHGAGFFGYSGYIARYTAQKTTVIVLTNSDQVDAEPTNNALAAITLSTN
jgi:CubicO group peptidase (beta-lactamase class C family)